jgi:hypothetical protein
LAAFGVQELSVSGRCAPDAVLKGKLNAMKTNAKKRGKGSERSVPPRASAPSTAPRLFGWGDKSHEALQALHGPVGLSREHADLISELSRLVDRAGSIALPATQQALADVVRTATREVTDRMSTNLRGVRSAIESAARAPD